MDKEQIDKNISDTKDMVVLAGTHVAELAEGEDNPLSKLTDMERRYVEAYAALAGQHGAMTNAARYAGYAEKTCAVKGSQLIRKPKILAALRYLTEHKAHASSILAISVMEQLMTTGTDAIRFKAADRILGYAGIIVKTIHKHEHEITDNRTPAQIKAAIAEKAKKLGINVADMIDITPEKRPSNNPEGAPKYKKALIPNRQLTDEEVDDIDWLNAKVETK